MASPLAKMEKQACAKWSEKASATKSTAGSTCRTSTSRSQQSVIDMVRAQPGGKWPSPTINFILHELSDLGLVRFEVNPFGQKEWYANG